jgi:hypothetical protein
MLTTKPTAAVGPYVLSFVEEKVFMRGGVALTVVRGKMASSRSSPRGMRLIISVKVLPTRIELPRDGPS